MTKSSISSMQNRYIRTTRTLRFFALFATLIAMCLTLSVCAKVEASKPIESSTSTAPVAVECPLGDYKSATLAMINSIRAVQQSCGAAADALRWNDKLEAAAAVHSNDMAINDYFAHEDANGVRVGKRVRATGYSYDYVGENVAAGQSNVKDVFLLPNGQGWMSSAAHCRNIMKASHKNVGASCKYNANSKYQYYWTLVLGD